MNTLEQAPQPYFSMPSPPHDAEDHLRAYTTAQQRSLGRITRQGEPITPLTEYTELDPSVRKLVDYLYENTELAITVADAQRTGHPNTKQLWLDVDFLVDHGIVEVVIHNQQRVVFLTAKGERVVDDQ